MAANYNNSAWFYDRLSRLVYGKALINAQVYLLQYIGAGSNLLIVGGGTGWILDEITRLHPSGLQITYVEISANMTDLSRKRNTGNNQVTFINLPIEDADIQTKFDVVFTPFLFDNFTDDTMHQVFNSIHQLLKTEGTWLNTDFQLTGKWWQNALLRSMFIFFRTICRIEASNLPDIEGLFQTNGYKTITQKTFFGDFVISTAYKKNEG